MTDSRVAGVVLCGGRSSRMGQPKFALPVGDETMLQRVTRILAMAVDRVIVVAAADQELPDLAPGATVIRDQRPYQGPLPALGHALDAAAQQHADAAYVSACDVPLLQPAFVRRLIGELGSHDLVICRDGKYFHPLAAVYRTRLAALVRQLVDGGARRPVDLIEASNARIVDVESLRDVGPRLDSLRNVNTPEDYQQILTESGG